MAGFIKVDRDLIDHPAFRERDRDAYSAFLWLVQEAALTPRSIGYGRRAVQIQRGQLSHSIRYLGEQWGWARMRVHRFIKRLTSEGLILVDSVIPRCYESGTASGTAETVITICNYDAFSGQSESLGQHVIQERDGTGTSNKNLRKEEKRKSTHPMGESPSRPGKQPDLLGAEVIEMPPDEVRQAFEAYKLVAGDLGLSVPRAMSGKRRPLIRARLKEEGAEKWSEALQRLRNAVFITSGSWRGFDIDDFANRVTFTKLMAGRYDVVFGQQQETTWERERREYLESGGENSLYRGMKGGST